MSFSNLKVGTRLALGFAVLLAISLAVGGVSWLRMSQIDDSTDQIVEQEYEKVRLTMQMQIRSRDNASKAARMLLAGGDQQAIDTLKAEMSENSKLNEADLAALDELVTAEDDQALLTQAAAAREKYNASRAHVVELAKEPKTHAQALETYRTE